jgi:hypothetical protein
VYVPNSSSFAGAIAAVDRWLTPRRIRLYCAAILVASIVAAAATILAGNPPFDVFGRPIAEDFTAQMTAGQIANAGRIRDLYDPMAQREVQQRILGPGHELYVNLFLMPPFAAYLYAPFARLPYLVAVGLWTCLSIALVGAACVALRPLARRLFKIDRGSLLLVVFSSAPVFELLGDGQDAALSLAIVVGGLRLLEGGHDLTAGAVLALGLFKPQLLALIPVLLFVERRWGALGAWMLVAASLAGLSLALIGRDGVASYRALLESDLYRIGISEGLRWKMQSLPALLEALFPPELRPRGAGLARDALPMAVAATVLVFALYCDRERRGNPRSIKLPFALTLLLDACANPHFLLYDAAILLVPSWILLDSAADDPRLTVALLALYLLLWTAPFRHALMGDLAWPLSLPAASWAAVPTAWLALEAIRRLGRGSVAPG